MNLIILFKDDFIGQNLVRLTDRRHIHILKVLKACVGDSLQVGLLNGKMGTGVIKEKNENKTELEVNLNTNPPKKLPITLILSLPRPLVLNRVIIAATVMGTTRIILINSKNVEKSFWKSHFLKNDSVERQLILALEQAKDTAMPEVLLKRSFKKFAEEEVSGISKNTTALIAHPQAQINCPYAIEGPITLAIGPEGGFIPYEIEKFVSCGFSAVRLGERILNVETAVSAFLSRLC